MSFSTPFPVYRARKASTSLLAPLFAIGFNTRRSSSSHLGRKNTQELRSRLQKGWDCELMESINVHFALLSSNWSCGDYIVVTLRKRLETKPKLNI